MPSGLKCLWLRDAHVTGPSQLSAKSNAAAFSCICLWSDPSSSWNSFCVRPQLAALIAARVTKGMSVLWLFCSVSVYSLTFLLLSFFLSILPGTRILQQQSVTYHFSSSVWLCTLCQILFFLPEFSALCLRPHSCVLYELTAGMLFT